MREDAYRWVPMRRVADLAPLVLAVSLAAVFVGFSVYGGVGLGLGVTGVVVVAIVTWNGRT